MARLPPRVSTPTSRKQLPLRDAPYWTELRQGLRLGYRKGQRGAGVWVLREFRGGRYLRRRLGLADDVAPADGTAVLSYEQAQKIALGSERPTVTQGGRYKVADAWEAYRSTRRTPPDARETATWERFIKPALGSCEVSELDHHTLSKWLRSQVSKRGVRGQSEGAVDDKELLRRAQYTANRRWALLRAILNYAFRTDAVKSDAPWRKVQPFQRVDQPRTVTASVEQARKLLGKLEGPLRALARGALYTGLRLGELLGLRVCDIDIPAARIRVRHGKAGERFVPLNREGRAFFAECVKDKSTDAPVFEPLHADAVANRVYIARAMRAASAAAEIIPRLTFHDLRRSYGSLMLNAGASIESVQQVLGHADMRMMRRVYAHLLQDTVAEQVQKHLPSFEDVAKRRRKSAA